MTVPRHRSRGHTLLELMIAAALGLVVVAGAVSMYRSQRAAFVRATDALRIHDAGMTALALIAAQVRMAGFVPADMESADTSAGLFGCSGARAVGTFESRSCESLASGSDSIAVRYIGDMISTWPSSTGRPTDCLGQSVTTDAAGSDPQRIPIVNRFHARTGSADEPELYCDGSGRSGVAQPLVEGVEGLRVRYWLRDAPSALDASAVAPGQWQQIVAVDLCVLVRGAPLGRRTRYVDCDGVSMLATDTRVRQAFWRRVAVRNQERRSS